MTRILFLRHFETQVDEDKPVSEWDLTEDGEEAMAELLDSDIIAGLDRVYSSPEHKALRTARAVADEVGAPMEEVEAIEEVDRSGEGFIEDHDEYVRMVGQYLRNPTVPFDWEDREHVEDRIRTFLETVDTADDRVMAVSHGMFLSTLLPRLEEKDPYEFWQDLGFGELIEVEHEALLEAIEE